MMSNSQTVIMKLERNKTERMTYEGIFNKGEAIVAQGKSIDSLNGIELVALLDWYQVSKNDQGNKPEKKQKWISIQGNECL